MKKNIMLSLIAFSFLVFINCDGDSPNSTDPVDEQTAQELFSKVMSSVNNGIQASINPLGQTAVSSKDTGDKTINWSNNAGTLSVAGVYNTTNLSGNVTLTFNNFTDGELTINGSTNCSIALAERILTYTYIGQLEIIYQQETYTFSWDYSASLNLETKEATASGTYTINGQTFNCINE